MRRSRYLLFAALLAVTLPGTAAAQGLVQITPKLGVHVQSESVQTIDDGARDVVRTGSGDLAVGANIEIALSGPPIGIRGDLSLGTNAKVTTGGIEGHIDATVLALAADAVLRPLSFLPLLDPYGLVGLGLTSTSFDEDDVQRIPDIDEMPTDREFALHAGVGTDLSVGGVQVQAEVTDYVSGLLSDSETGHDLFFTIGLGFGLF